MDIAYKLNDELRRPDFSEISNSAEQLSISKNTVSRHRQDILAKLQVRNYVEACRVAKALAIICKSRFILWK